MTKTHVDLLDRIVGRALQGGLPVLIFAIALMAGALALQLTPREEEPQIVVPMVDIQVQAPGLSAAQIERQVTIPMEKLLAQIPGVEHLYAASATGASNVTLRFYVGEDREDAILNTYNKLYANQDRIPADVRTWKITPVEVDDIPIMLLGLWSDDSHRYNDYELRRIADEISTLLQAIPHTSEINVVGGRPRTVQILLDPTRLAARKTTPVDIIRALEQSNRLSEAGNWILNNQVIRLQSGDFIADAQALEQLAINVVDGVPVYLRDVAQISDGPAEASNYSWIDFAPGHPDAQANNQGRPMVAISIAKQRGSNAVAVAEAVHAQLKTIRGRWMAPQVHIEVLRDYGQTADEKVNDLMSSLAFAVLTVVVFIGVFLGWRHAIIVGLAVPICYGITLALDLMFGYTINRVTLFALILSLGLLVDDPITGVDNIERFIRTGKGGTTERIIAAIREIRVPLIMSSVAIVFAFLPLAYISGMMGPYMAPMAFNVPVSVLVSTLVAFVVTPWLAAKLLRPAKASPVESNHVLERVYRRLLAPFLSSRRLRRHRLAHRLQWYGAWLLPAPSAASG